MRDRVATERNDLASFTAWLVDLDGTLYHPKPVKMAMAGQLLLFGAPRLRVIRAFRKQHERIREEGLDGEGDPFALQLRLTAEALGAEVEEVEAVIREWMVKRPGPWLRRFRRRGLLSEIADFRAHGGRTALVSDYPAREKLKALGGDSLFEVVVASGEEGGPKRLKPSPDGYLAAARALGVDPERCLVVGDRDDADGEAARRAGMAFREIP
jgi:HAD superfamily hydrolase (TIGR01549 family)